MNFPTPLEAVAANPHRLDDDDRVILPDGRVATLFRVGYTLAQAKADDGSHWVGRLADLRPYSPARTGNASQEQEQLSLW